MKTAASIILALALADEQTLADIKEFCDAIMVKSPMDDPSFVEKLDKRMSESPGSAKTSESGSEFSPEVPEDTAKNQ